MNVKSVIGMNVNEAVKLLKESGFTVNQHNEGMPHLLTCDYRLDRVTIVVTNNIVTNASLG